MPSWRQVASLLLMGIGGVAAATMIVYASVPVPSPDQDTRAQTTYVYYDDGKTLIGSWSSFNRTIVPLSAIPKPVQDAVLSAEDRTFYENRGISVTGLLRAVWSNSSGGNLQGGSTITQQYVKIVLLRDSSRTVSRKVKEFVIALKISRDEPKPDILKNYLNAIYFGRGAYGIDAAAQAYFGHPAAKLTTSEGAFLAGIINGPSLYEPTDPDALTKANARWEYVVDGMVTMGAITAQQRAQLSFPKNFVAQRQQTTGTGDEPQNRYMMDMVAREMAAAHDVTDAALKTKGYRIVTTFNKKMADDAVKAVRDKLGPRNGSKKKKKKGWPTGTQAALVSIDPATGSVKAIYAGDGKTRFVNAVMQDTAQAGSTFKPFTLIAALEGDRDGAQTAPAGLGVDDAIASGAPLSLRSRFDGRSPQTFPGLPKPVKNAEGSYGMIDLVTATAHSVNTVFVALNQEVGPERTRDVASRAGVPKDALKTKGLNNVLGVDDPHPIDMASAYATIAAQGVYHKPHVIAKIRTSEGGVICCQATPGESRFDRGVIADTTYAMHQVIRNGTGRYALNLDRPAAGKTGTTDDNISAWFVGFTPQLSTAVAMYRIDPKPPHSPVPLKGFQGFSDSQMAGGSLPVRVWTHFMSLALDGKPVKNLPQPVWGGADQIPTTTTTSSPAATTTSRPPSSSTVPEPTQSSSETETPTWTPTSDPTIPLPTFTTPTISPTTRIRPTTP
jgi:membrane peptidoglycan carboxypeptidase